MLHMYCVSHHHWSPCYWLGTAYLKREWLSAEPLGTECVQSWMSSVCMRAYWQCAVDVNWTLVAMWWKLPRSYRSFAVFSLTSAVTGLLRVSASFNFVARCTHLLWNSSRCHAACQTVGGWWHGSVPIVSRAGGSAHSHVGGWWHGSVPIVSRAGGSAHSNVSWWMMALLCTHCV